MKVNKILIIKYLLPLLLAVACGVLYWHDIGLNVEYQIADKIYQQETSSSGSVFILEIDAKSLEELGPYQTWTRDYVAEAIERLNQIPEEAPAVIGVDVLYIGETNADSDAHLANACAVNDNVVLGSFLNIETVLSSVGGKHVLEDKITLYEEPFDELLQVTSQGFVNGFSDKDGIVRHGLLEATLPDGRCIPSFSYAVYQKYAEEYGLPTEIEVPQNKDGYWYLSYQTLPGGYSNSYSLSDFIQGEIPMDRLAGNIVLIGPYAEGLMDSHRTAIDHTTSMYGVEIHANMIDAMLIGDFKHEISKFSMTLLIIVMSYLACFVCRSEKLRYPIMVAAFGGIGYPVLAYVLGKVGIILNIIYIPIICLVIAIIGICIRYIKTLTQKLLVEKTFKRYVAPEVVDKIMKTGMDNIELGGASVDIACLFVDIRGFTTMSEMLPPEKVVEILNQYLSLTSECIFKHHGTLDKFIGDATMAIFNAPLPQEDYIYEAVMTAWDMVQGAEKLGQELKKQYGRSISFGIGVHCGKAVVGNIGTDRRMDYTAIGDTVNTAARLESNAPAGTVLISSAVYEAVQGRIKAVSLGNLPLKGKSADIEVFKVESIEG